FPSGIVFSFRFSVDVFLPSQSSCLAVFQSAEVLRTVGSAGLPRSFPRRSQSQFERRIRRPTVQEAEHFGDYERRGRRSDKRHSHRLTREVEASALINAEGEIGGVLVRDLRSVRMLSLAVCFGDIGPEF